MKTVLSYAIESIESLQINLLDVLIPDNKMLNKTSKDIYLNKVNNLFEKLRSHNYERLISQKNDTLNDVFLFYTYDYLYCFTVYLKIDIDQAAISEFSIIDDLIENDLPQFANACNLRVIVFKDEYVDFIPTNKCIQQTNIYLAAISEFTKSNKIAFCDLLIIEDWLDNYGELYDLINPQKLQYSAHYKFYFLYNLFLDLISITELKADLIQANESFMLLNLENDMDLQDWYLKYEYLCIETAVFSRQQLSDTSNELSNYIQIPIFENQYVHFEILYFSELIQFYSNVSFIKNKDLLVL